MTKSIVIGKFTVVSSYSLYLKYTAAIKKDTWNLNDIKCSFFEISNFVYMELRNQPERDV